MINNIHVVPKARATDTTRPACKSTFSHALVCIKSL